MQKPKMQEIKAFVPAKNFETSLAFYQDLGFEVVFSEDGIAHLKYEQHSFMLQEFYVADHTNNFMMHILVDDVGIWHQFIVSSGIVEKYKVRLTPVVEQAYGMRDFTLTDPSGVLWFIGQEIDTTDTCSNA
ncbi:VOC family protein [Undibacterium sp. Tian12W]|uniref:VOC family protein n=1 Tax=Undibacterium sp. Tian12W TaxID=3413054 RepID=UPI003BF1D7E4